MHYEAEYGIAAHWRYKETKGSHKGDNAEVDQMAWMRQLLDWQKEAADPNEFLDSLRYDLSTNQIFAFTPKGDAITLPAGSTPVDFAYAVHTEVGHRCIGAKVNGRLVALETTLNTGDKVEVFTSKDAGAGPSKDWESFVVSPRAKNKIRAWFNKERREESLEKGKEALAHEAQRTGIPLQRLVTAEALKTVAASLQRSSVDDLYDAIGKGGETAGHVVKLLKEIYQGDAVDDADDIPELTPARSGRPGTHAGATRAGRGDGSGVLVQGNADFSAKLAKCCTPVPGDDIFGFITKNGGVSVHRTDCTNAEKLHAEPERIIEVSWALRHPRCDVHGDAADRGARPDRAAVGGDPGGQRAEGADHLDEHPCLRGPGGGVPVHFRGLRHQAAGLSHEPAAQRGGRVRRLPRDDRRVALAGRGDPGSPGVRSLPGRVRPDRPLRPARQVSPVSPVNPTDLAGHTGNRRGSMSG
jgi:(p)ppGpp synthase/HD superfamily hydrolase